MEMPPSIHAGMPGWKHFHGKCNVTTLTISLTFPIHTTHCPLRTRCPTGQIHPTSVHTAIRSYWCITRPTSRSFTASRPGSSPYQVVGSVTGHSYASLTLQSPRPSRCPGLTTSTGQRSCCEPSAVVRCVWPRTWNRLPTALRSPELSLSSFKRQLKTHLSVPVLDSAGCSCGCRIPSSGAVVSVSLQHTREIDLWISAIRRGHRGGVMGRPSPATRLTWLWWWWWWWWCNVMQC